MVDYTPTLFARELVARLRGEIARYDVSQEDLAILCDVSQSQFSKIIRGVRPMSVDQMVVICDALEIDFVQLAQQIETFVQARDALPSALYFVSDGDRHETPKFRGDDWLDPYGLAAAERLRTAGRLPTK